MSKAARPQKFDHLLLIALIRQESNFNPLAVSHAGAKGLMQVMDATFKEHSKAIRLKNADPFNPLHNIIVGCLELNRQIDNFGDIELALTAYNWGSGNLTRFINQARTKDFQLLKIFVGEKKDKEGNLKPWPMPKEAKEYAQRIFNHYNDPQTLELMDDYLKIIN